METHRSKNTTSYTPSMIIPGNGRDLSGSDMVAECLTREGGYIWPGRSFQPSWFDYSGISGESRSFELDASKECPPSTFQSTLRLQNPATDAGKDVPYTKFVLGYDWIYAMWERSVILPTILNAYLTL